MSCAAQLKMINGDPQLNAKLTHSLETTFQHSLIVRWWHP